MEIIRREAADLVKVKVMKQGGLLRTLAMVQCAAAAGLRVVLGHGFGLTLSTYAEAAVAAVSTAVIDGCEAVGPLKMAGDVVDEPARLEGGVIRLPDAPGLGAPPSTRPPEALSRRPRRECMKNGFKVLDSDLHTMEPDGLWERYLDEPFKKFAPKFTRREDNAPNQPVISIGNLELAEFSKRARTAKVGKDLHERSFARHPHYAVAHARGYDSADTPAGHGHRGHRRRRDLRHTGTTGAHAR